MTKKESKNSAENDNQEIDSTFRTEFYGSLLNPRYTSAKLLSEAAEIARNMNSYPTTGILSAHALKYLQEEKENRRLEEKFHSSPVGELLK